MIVNNVFLEAVGVEMKQYPSTGLPEIAFIGRSNVGKSSLLNSLINRKALARTSQNPGKTRTINFYNVEGKLYFVDLPGYGYARASKSESEKWGKMIETYLQKRETLKAIAFLVDIRHEPSSNDKMMFDWLMHYGYKTVIIATKLDKVSKSQVQKNLAVIRRTLDSSPDIQIVPFSSLSKSGKETVWQEIEKLLELQAKAFFEVKQ